MAGFFTRFRYEIVLVLSGLAILLLLGGLLDVFGDPAFFPDSREYLESARNLYTGPRGHQYRPLLMAALSGLPYLFGAGDAGVSGWIVVLNTAAWLGTALVIFHALKGYGKTWAWVFALVFLTLAGAGILAFHLLADVLFMALLAAFLFGIRRYRESGRPQALSWALALLAASMLVKPASQFLAVFFLLYFIRAWWKWKASKVWLPLYAAVALVVLQMAGLRHQFGNFTISYIDAPTLHNYLLGRSQAITDGMVYEAGDNRRAEAFYRLSPKGQKKAAMLDLKMQLRYRPESVAQAYALDLFDNATQGSHTVLAYTDAEGSLRFPVIQRVLYDITKWQNRILSVMALLLSVFFLLRKRNDIWLFALSATALYLMLLSGISNGEGDRFHTAVFPVSLMLLGVFLSEVRPFSGRLRTASRPRT